MTLQPADLKEITEMTSTDQERWSRVKERLRAEVGDDIFSSWFAHALPQELDSITLPRSPARLLAGGGSDRAPD
jgi:hypothetical protein